jgi:TRAP-type C4-dicarboxylate transport system substrate-binding protein
VVIACNKAWLNKLPADLRAIVMEEAAKSEAAANEFGVQDITRSRDVWTLNGGQMISLSADDAATFSKTVNQTATEIINKNAAAKGAFETYASLVRKYK